MKLLDPDSKLYQILSTAASFIALNLLWLLCRCLSCLLRSTSCKSKHDTYHQK